MLMILLLMMGLTMMMLILMILLLMMMMLMLACSLEARRLSHLGKKERKNMNKRKRVVTKSGTTNVDYKNISKKRRRYFLDLYTTLLGRVEK